MVQDPQDQSSQDASPQDESFDFEGESNVTIDGKGRFAVPGRYRKQLAEQCHGQVVITLSFIPVNALPARTQPFRRFKGLSILPLPTWRKFKSYLASERQARASLGIYVASALTCKVDGQGRILVPPALRDFLIRREQHRDGETDPGKDEEKSPVRLTFVGLTDRFELWREEEWESVRVEMLGAAAEKFETDPSVSQDFPF